MCNRDCDAADRISLYVQLTYFCELGREQEADDGCGSLASRQEVLRKVNGCY